MIILTYIYLKQQLKYEQRKDKQNLINIIFLFMINYNSKLIYKKKKRFSVFDRRGTKRALCVHSN